MTRKQTPASKNGHSPRTPVVLFMTATCVKCQVLREILNAKGLRFRIRDVIQDAGAMLDLAKLTGGRVSVPVLQVGRKAFVDPDWNEVSGILRRRR